MTRKNAIILGVAALVAVGTVVYVSGRGRKRKTLKMQQYEVAEEGYETAFDILFPEKKKKFGRYTFARN